MLACLPCPPGQSSKAASSACTVCPAGLYAEEKSTEVCMECPAGYVSQVAEATKCKSCTSGTFATTSGQSGCHSCPPQSTSPPRSTSDAACICKKGYFAERLHEEGNVNSLVCTSCPPRSSTFQDNATSRDACVCDEGFWKPPNSLSLCESCPPYAVCAVGKTPMTIRGYWRVPWRNDTLNVGARIACLDVESCLGASTGEMSPTNDKEECAPYHSGPLCAACTNNAYKKAASYLCLPCYDSPEMSALFMVFVVCSALSLIAAMTAATVADGGQASAVDVVILKVRVFFCLIVCFVGGGSVCLCL